MRTIRKSYPAFNHVDQKDIDRNTGSIRNVVIINAGTDKVGDNIDQVFLSQVVASGNAQGQGVKCRFGHPNLCDDALGTYIGRYKNFRVSGDSVLADLYLDPVSTKSPKGNLYEYILDLSQKANDMFGNSIVFRMGDPEFIMVKDDAGKEGEQEFIRLNSLIASDLVDSPAATNSLFKSEEDFAGRVTDFLDENPEIFDMMQKSPGLLKTFLEKYSNYKKVKSASMEKKSSGIIASVKKSLSSLLAQISGGEKSIDLTSADGSLLHISDNDDDGRPAIGDQVTVDGKDNPDGDYLMPAGETIVVSGGVITDIQTAPEAPAVQQSNPKEGEVKSDSKEIETLKADLQQKDSRIKELEEELEECMTAMKGFQEEFEKLKNEVRSDYQPKKRKTDFQKSQSQNTGGPFSKLLSEQDDED